MTYNLIMYLGDQSRSFSGTKANGQNAMTEWTYNAVYNSIMGMLLYEKRQHRKKSVVTKLHHRGKNTDMARNRGVR